MNDFDFLLVVFIVITYLYYSNEAFFYKQMKKACKVNKGNCEECRCWSCPVYENLKNFEKGNV